MKNFFSFGMLTLLLCGAGVAVAQVAPYPYADAPGDSATEEAVRVLTEMGVVGGYSDDTFRPRQFLNRAEYMKIVMSLKEKNGTYAPRCFPDVPEGSWFEPSVCRAKTLGIVHGYPPPDYCTSRCTRMFYPTRNVNYVEALKVLIGMYDIPVRNQRSREEWYERYLDAAMDRDLALLDMKPGDALTRGNMAVLTYNFIVYDSAHSSFSSSSSSRSSSSVSSSSRSSSSSSVPIDPLSDSSPRSQLILLGEVSPMLGAASFFSDAEPIDGTKIHIDFGANQNDIRSLLVYDENRRLLGRAYRNGSVQGRFTITLQQDVFVLPKRENRKIYVRADLRSKDDGGSSQVLMQISQFQLEGNGAWSGSPYTVTSSDTFDTFMTSRSTMTSITNAGPQTDLLIAGPNRTLGSFRFQGRVSDSSARINLTSIVFSLYANNIGLTDVRLGADSTSTTIACSVGSQTVTCDPIDEFIGSLTGGPRTLTLYGDITILNPALQTTLLQVSLNNLGSAVSGGTIHFSDGTLEFTWVSLTSPAVTSISGTQYTD